MNYETILYSAEQGVATLTFNRPETLNAFNDQMIRECIQALKTAARDPEVRCVIITGSGRGFCSGQDLAEVMETWQAGDKLSTRETLLTKYHVFIRQIVTLEKPVIGVLNGIAAGIGMSVALATDIRIASDKAAFTLAFSKIGLVPDGGANWLLTRLIGYARAYELAITAEKLTAAQALEWGLINKLVPHDQLSEFTAAYAQKLAQGAPLAYAFTKRAMLQGLNQSFAENLNYEAHLQEVATQSQDCQEGIAAFLEKRPPQFTGK